MSRTKKQEEVPQDDDFVIGDVDPVFVDTPKFAKATSQPAIKQEPEQRYVFKREVPCPYCGATITKQENSATLATKTEGQIQYRKCVLCLKTFKQVGTLVKF